MKKILALALAAVMVMALCGTALAMNITVNETAAIYEYDVYQIYTGDLSNHMLSNVKYGANYGTPGAAVPAAELEALEAISSGSDAMKAKARDIYAHVTGTPTTISYDSTDGYKSTDLPNGYYLIVEKYAAGVDIPEGSELSINIVTIQDTDLVINPKRDTTTSEKVITGDTLGAGDTNTFVPAVDTDNVSIGDTVHFQISTQVSANAAEYDRYFFIIEDTLSDGLTYTAGSLKVYKTSVDDANKLTLEADDGYDLTVSGQNIKVGLRNAKALANTPIIVTYDAVLNENAKIGEEGNPNTEKVIYSNDPHHNYDGDKDSTKPGFPDSTKNPPMGETPESTTETYTTGIKIQKVDENGNVLTGAGFTITGDSTEIVLVSEETFTAADDGAYYKLKNDTYTTQAPQEEDKMQEVSGASAGYVEDSTYTEDDKVVVGGITYRPYKPSEDTGKTVYKLIEANVDQYDNPSTKYNKTVSYTQKQTTGTSAVTATQMVGADGVVEFRGLGAGEYTITETTTPAGYNTIAPINFTIVFDKDGNPKWSTTSSDASYNSTTGYFELTIVNRGGKELPSTGGIGTTIFYVTGLIMVLGASIILISRRRADAK